MAAPSASVLVDEFVAEMKAAGLTRVWQTRAEVQPPGFYVALEEINYVLAADVLDVTARVYAVSGIADEDRAMRDLDELHRQYIDAGFVPEGTTSVVGLNIPGQVKPLPALRISVSLTQ